MKWNTTFASIKQGIASGEIQLILQNSSNINEAYLSSIAHTKRFLERWTADPKFREIIKDDPIGVTKEYNLKANPEEIRLLWDKEALINHPKDAPVPLVVKRYESFIQEKLAYRDILRSQAHPKNPHFKNWRMRNVYRSFSELGIYKAHGIVHAPLVFELSQGCSVGCWFCGVSAQKLKDNFEFTPANEALWRGILEVIYDLFGSAAGKGFCYWASDPMDNDNYLNYLKAYNEILGNVPQTTTAIPMKSPQKIREIFEYSKEHNGELNRFSILTLKQLTKVHNEFTAEELLLVELVTQNKGALTVKAVAGRAREPRFRKKIQEMYGENGPVLSSTISCVSGFLINMVEKNIRLISPCNASDKWPLGYMIYKEETFTDVTDFRNKIEAIIKEKMPTNINLDAIVQFRSDLEYEDIKNGFRLLNKVTKHTFENVEIMTKVGAYIAKGPCSVTDMVLDLNNKFGFEMSEIMFYINELFKLGIFHNEPDWIQSPGVKNQYAEEQLLQQI